MTRRPLSEDSEWTFERLQRYDEAIAELALGYYGLDTYPNQLEVVNSEQMMDAYASVGMPIGYNHWSFGKQFVGVEQSYQRGQMGLAYELVINSNPTIAYLMEENTMTMQATVIAHACYGHNSFFKNNYLFRTWTDADGIIDYLVFAKRYISECEERYGVEAVENTLDSCHALMNYGVDRYQRPPPLTAEEAELRLRERERYKQFQYNDIWRTLPEKAADEAPEEVERFPAEPHENVLYFVEKHAPLLEPWQRELVRIVRKLAQYFYPQRQTKVMNEGWATFWHYTLIHDLYDRGLVTDAFMLEFLQAHTGVILQPDFDSPYYSGINPYALGFAIFSDLRRMSEEPTEEDHEWFPSIAGKDWLPTLDFAMRNFKDESFISQYLSPRVIRDFRLFSVMDDDQRKELEISGIHDERGYRYVRQSLSAQFNLGSQEPNIQVYDFNYRGDRSLTLRHFQHNRRPLQEATAKQVLKHLYRLWGFPVRLESVDEDGRVRWAHKCGEGETALRRRRP